MRYLWLFYFPLLFLPNLGFSQATAFGTLEFSDFLIGPYLVLLVFAINWGDKLNIGRLTPWMGIFIAWALFSTITISLRYGVPADFIIRFGLYKIAKMGLYGVAGILTARALTRESTRLAFDWSMLAAAVVTGVSLWSTRVGPVEERITIVAVQTQVEQATGYTATNGISVMAALLIVYLTGRWLTGGGTRLWRLVAPLGFIITVAGMAVSDGRGGWLAALAGAIYLAFRLRFNWRILAMIGAGVLVVLALYQTQPEFRQQVDVTLFLPTEQYGYQGTRTVGTVDDGARIQTWDHEMRKLDNAPILGAGMYNRGGVSGLWTTGSHNFWIQMFLETGIVGGLRVLAIPVVMWKQVTRLRHAAGDRADVALKAAIIAALVGGMGGEYFYGGIILFTFFAVYAQTGGLAWGAVRSAAEVDDRRRPRRPDTEGRLVMESPLAVR
jgi:O-antigen ligase